MAAKTMEQLTWFLHILNSLKLRHGGAFKIQHKK